MNFKIRCQGLFFGTVFLLVGCFGDGGSDYPPLKKSQLVGCWVEIFPPSKGECAEQCFSQNGTVYRKKKYPTSTNGLEYFVEWNGSYRLLGGLDLNVNISSRSSQDTQIVTDEFKQATTIIRDTLNYIAKNGTLDPYARRDSTHNCGPHWMLFPKPADWELP